MTQEPWNEEIYPTRTSSRKERGKKAAISTRIFTFLITVFIIVVIVITAVAFYLSNGGSNTNSTKEFYNTSSSSQAAASQAAEAQASSSSEAASTEQEKPAEEATASSAATPASSVAGETLTVEAGEGESSIAARAGISIADLERLNPDKMTTGSWFANPGDIVKIK